MRSALRLAGSGSLYGNTNTGLGRYVRLRFSVIDQ